MMLNFARITRLARIGKPSPASNVIFEFGRGDASILAEIRDDGRARLTLGSGEEFVGPYDEMPITVVRGARRLLDAAGSSSQWFRSHDGRPRDGAPVRVLVKKADEIREFHVTLGELRDPDSTAAPLWRAFTSWLEPFLVVLFPDTPQRASSDEGPALARARALSRGPEGTP